MASEELPEGLPKLAFSPFVHLACAHHAEPFRSEYPSGGFVPFTISLIKAAFENVEVQQAAGAGEDGWEERLLAVLEEKPACEWVTTDELKKLYRTARPNWPLGVCQVCRLFKPGTSYTSSMLPSGRGPTKTHTHVCLDCIVDRFKTQRP